METRDTILICPLNWGLGHASRCIPVVRRLLLQNYRVIIAGERPVTELVHTEFPFIETEWLPGKQIFYSKRQSQTLRLLQQLPAALLWVFRERKLTARLVEKYKPVCIISDNRYGVRHPKVKSIIITHQLMLKLPKYFGLLERPVNRIINRFVLQFDSCWVPDNPPPYTLAGDLAHKFPLPPNARLTGALSRFMDEYPRTIPAEKFDLLAIISGPEPQRTILQKKLTEKLASENLKCLIVAGTLYSNSSLQQFANIKTVPHLATAELAAHLATTPAVVSRSGYTTIMDLWFLNRTAILIPTPGQTEQEYLAKKTALQNHIYLPQQAIASFNFAQSNTGSSSSLHPTAFNHLLDEAIAEITRK